MPMNVKDYRRKIEQSVAKAEARPARSASRSQPNLRRAVMNKKTPAKKRAETLGRLMRDEGADVVPETVLERLADPKESPIVRRAAIKLLQQAQIFNSVAAEWRPAFVEALRAAARDPKVRSAAFEVLSLMKDRPTQALLLEGLRKPKQALVPVEDALRLLSTDVHADVIAVAKTLTASRRMRRNTAAFVQAVRILGADPGSVGRLQEILASDAYAMDARRLAATALDHLAPEVLPRAADTGRGRRARAGTKAPGQPAPAAGPLAQHLATLRKIRE
jgi:hypothetical protein